MATTTPPGRCRCALALASLKDCARIMLNDGDELEEREKGDAWDARLATFGPSHLHGLSPWAAGLTRYGGSPTTARVKRSSLEVARAVLVLVAAKHRDAALFEELFRWVYCEFR